MRRMEPAKSNRPVRTSSTTASHPSGVKPQGRRQLTRSRTRGSRTGKQRRSGIVRSLAAPDSASRLERAEGDRKLKRGAWLKRRFDRVIGATTSSRGGRKREPGRSLTEFRLRQTGRSKPIGSATSSWRETIHAEAQATMRA